ncbi:YchJ family protein [Pelobacter seleniigenes]|uniref:YchJ family protein n=1 Tax=Pelobacter seleniigenes TaxID=407188 RepID=UPI0004A783C8|nr:YchJ family protein [Pelobacter seleniigenes]
MSHCPCGSGQEFADCCEPIISGAKAAETAEQLMRARYTAHDQVAVDFLYSSIHPDHRQGFNHNGTRDWAEKSDWLGLEVVATEAGGADDEEGEVEFIARYRLNDSTRNYHERGHFKRQDGQWFFTDGELVKGQPIKVTKIGRNDPCPCGSGKKYKKCCG